MAHTQIGLYPGGLKHHHRWLSAFEAGLRRHGVEALWNPADCELAVMWSHRNTALIRQQRQSGRQYLVMEAGYIGNRLENTSIGYNGLNGYADFCVEAVPADRWCRFADLMKPWRTGGEYYLLIGQVPGDASLKGNDMSQWLRQIPTEIKGLPVYYRPHPLGAANTHHRRIEGSLSAALDSARAVITFNSNTAVEAVLAGVPAITLDRGSMAWEVSSHSLEGALVMPPRQRWAERLAYCQWTQQEIESGAAWAHLKYKLQ